MARDAAAGHLEADELARGALGLDRARARRARRSRPCRASRPSRGPPRSGSSSRRCRCRRARGAPRGGACRARRGRTARARGAGRASSSVRHSCGGVVRRAEDLDAVLAGVAGARDGAASRWRATASRKWKRRELASGGAVAAGERERSSNAFGPWSAMSAVRSEASSKSQWCSAAFAKCGGHLLAVRRVADDEPALLRDAVDDEVVEDGAVLVARARVERLAVVELRRVVRDRGSSTTCAAYSPAHHELAHVRDVEEAGRRAHRACARRRRPCTAPASPSRRTGPSRAEPHVLVVEGRAVQGGGGSRGSTRGAI